MSTTVHDAAPHRRPPRVLGWLAALLALTLVLSAAIFLITRPAHPLVATQGSRVRLPDGLYYLLITRQYWLGAHPNVYSLPAQLDVLARTFPDRSTTEGPKSLPVNVLPTAFLVLLPLVPVTNLDAAFALLNGLGLALLLLALRRVAQGAPLSGGGLARRAAPLVLLFSAAMGHALINAQTSIPATACLLFLLARCTDPEPRRIPVDPVAIAAILVLSTKPQFLALGVGILAIHRRITDLAAGAALAALACALLGARMGSGWLGDYVQTLTLYRGDTVGAVYAKAFNPEFMNIFRYAFASQLDPATAARISWICLVAGCFTATLIGWLSPRRESSGASPVIRTAAVQALVGIYLLFSPHSAPYEEILFAVPLGAIALAHPSTSRCTGWVILRLALLFLILNRTVLGVPGLDPALWWILKALLVLVFVCEPFVQRASPKSTALQTAPGA